MTYVMKYNMKSYAELFSEKRLTRGMEQTLKTISQRIDNWPSLFHQFGIGCPRPLPLQVLDILGFDIVNQSMRRHEIPTR
jgi:hypothetical protein